MRILYVAHIEGDSSKGAANADMSLLAALERHGHFVRQVWNVGAPRVIRHDNLHLLLEAPRKCERVVLAEVSRASYDVVFANQPLSWRAARALGRGSQESVFIGRSHGWEPRVFEAHRNYASEDPRGVLRKALSRALRPLLHRQNKLLLKWADGLVVCSRDDKNFLLSNPYLASDRILALSPGLPPAFLESRPPPLTSARCQRLLYVGQFAPFKAPGVVASAMARIMAQRPQVTATWVCEASDHPRVMSLLPPEIRPKVTLLDWMPRSDLIHIYDAHGVYLFPSLFEGFAQTFLEAMSRGMAVLATRIDGMAQAIEHGINGFLFEPSQPQEMADVAVSMIDGDFDSAAIGAAATATAANYTWDRSADAFETFVDQIRTKVEKGSGSD